MKKSIVNLGKTLNKAEQKQIQGGNPECLNGYCVNNGDPCSRSYDCEWEWPL